MRASASPVKPAKKPDAKKPTAPVKLGPLGREIVRRAERINKALKGKDFA